MSSQLVELAALWKRKDGKPGLTGSLGPRARLLILANDKKRVGSNDPDYYLLVARQEQQSSAPASAPPSGGEIPRSPGGDL